MIEAGILNCFWVELVKSLAKVGSIYEIQLL